MRRKMCMRQPRDPLSSNLTDFESTFFPFRSSYIPLGRAEESACVQVCVLILVYACSSVCKKKPSYLLIGRIWPRRVQGRMLSDAPLDAVHVHNIASQLGSQLARLAARLAS